MYAANGAERHRMIETLRLQPKKANATEGDATAPKKRRRRRKPKAKTAADAGETSVATDNES